MRYILILFSMLIIAAAVSHSEVLEKSFKNLIKDDITDVFTPHFICKDDNVAIRVFVNENVGQVANLLRITDKDEGTAEKSAIVAWNGLVFPNLDVTVGSDGFLKALDMYISPTKEYLQLEFKRVDGDRNKLSAVGEMRKFNKVVKVKLNCAPFEF